MQAIYGPRGIKAGDLGDASVELIRRACRNLVDQGAEVIIPGFTEIPIVIDGLRRGTDIPIVDSNEVYAKYAIFSQLRSPPKQFKVGIIGGVGPAATVDFMNKIVAHTDAGKDQDHVKLVVEHNPQIPDRTENLMGAGMDPTIALYSACKKLESNDADVIAIPCNTAHAFIKRIQRHLSIPILEMPFEAVRHVSENHPQCKHLGLLATTGTVHSRVYHEAASELDLELIVPDGSFQEKVMDVIYGERGVKAGYVGEACRVQLLGAVEHLVAKGATAIVLGCTELPLVLPGTSELLIDGQTVLLLDPTEILAERCVALKGRSVATTP